MRPFTSVFLTAALAGSTTLAAVQLSIPSIVSPSILKSTRGGVPNQMCQNSSNTCEYNTHAAGSAPCGNPYGGYITCHKGNQTDECTTLSNSDCGANCADLLPAGPANTQCSGS